MTTTIINLAQDFVGSNNINLLRPKGQYGTRDQGGKDHASARYIFTEPTPITRVIYHPADDPLLNVQKEDNQFIEPEWYLPVIPLVLVNGAEGIGTGDRFGIVRDWSSVIDALFLSRLEYHDSMLQSTRYRREHSKADGR